MHRVMVTLPEEIHTQLKALARMEGVSVGQYITYAIARQIEAVENSDGPSKPVQETASEEVPSPGIQPAAKDSEDKDQATALGESSVDVDHL